MDDASNIEVAREIGLLVFPESFLDLGAFQLSQSVRGDPFCGPGLYLLHLKRGGHGGFVELEIALADLSQRPINCLLDEVSPVRRSRDYEW